MFPFSIKTGIHPFVPFVIDAVQIYAAPSRGYPDNQKRNKSCCVRDKQANGATHYPPYYSQSEASGKFPFFGGA
jgi:hypothetical protein